jgi:hypothetical protein
MVDMIQRQRRKSRHIALLYKLLVQPLRAYIHARPATGGNDLLYTPFQKPTSTSSKIHRPALASRPLFQFVRTTRFLNPVPSKQHSQHSASFLPRLRLIPNVDEPTHILPISPAVFCQTFNLESLAIETLSSPYLTTSWVNHSFSEVDVWRFTGTAVADRISRAARKQCDGEK